MKLNKINKKAVGNVLTTIGTAILVLVVIYILIAMFRSSTDRTIGGLNDCESKRYTCVKDKRMCLDQGGTFMGNFDCKEEDNIACCQFLNVREGVYDCVVNGYNCTSSCEEDAKEIKSNLKCPEKQVCCKTT